MHSSWNIDELNGALFGNCNAINPRIPIQCAVSATHPNEIMTV